MAGTSRNLSTADELDSTILRHQVNKYFSELQQETQSSVHDTPLNMDFLGIKRKTNISSTFRTPVADSVLPKKIKFDASGIGDSSLSGISVRKVQQQTPIPRANSLQAEKIVEMEQKLSEKQANILDLQQKLIQTQMKYKDLETEKQKLELASSSIEDGCKSRIKQFEEKIEDLHFEIKRLHQRNAELVKENLQKKSLAEKLKLASSEEKLAFNQQLIEKQQELEEIQTTYDIEIKELKHKLEQAMWETNKYRLEAEEANNKLTLQEKVQVPCNHESTIEHQRQVILQMENALFAQRTAASQSQEAKLARIPQLEKEIAKLQTMNQLYRETAANELLLKEQISALQENLKRNKDKCAMIPSMELDLKKAKEQLAEWENQSQNLFNTTSLSQMAKLVEEMRQKELALVNDIGNLQLELNSINRAYSALMERLEASKTEGKAKVELEDRIKKLERKVLVIQRDRDHYRAVSEMYEKEMTHIGAPAVASAEANRIQTLESLLDEYRVLLAAGEKSEQSKESQEATAQLNEEKNRLLQQIKELNHTIDSLKLQLEAASAHSVDPDTKVLHFTRNPLDNYGRQKMEHLAQLEKENAALKQRVRLMEAGHSSNLTLLVGEKFDEGFTPERFRQLEENLKSAELKNQRTEEAFSKYCSEFRRGVFHLFGYQVDFDDSGNFKVTSVYSDSNADYLAFKYAGEGLIIMDSPYIHTVDDLVQLHVHRQGSIPAFLAALTIELFSRQSMNASSFTSSLVP